VLIIVNGLTHHLCTHAALPLNKEDLTSQYLYLGPFSLVLFKILDNVSSCPP